MRTKARHKLAFAKLGPLLALAVVGLAAAVYFWKFAPIPRQLGAEIVGFEVVREPDAARTPPIRESLAVTVEFANGGEEPDAISRARFLVSGQEDLSDPRSWSTTTHRDSMLLDLKIPPGQSVTHTFVMPWTGREETLYLPEGKPIHLGFSIESTTPDGEPLAITERFGSVVQRDGRIVSSDHRLRSLALPSK